MASVNSKILDRVITHSVYLERFKNSVVKKDALTAMSSLRRSVGQIVRGMAGSQADKLSTKSAILQAVAQARSQVESRLNVSLSEFAGAEAEWNVRVLKDSVPIDVVFNTPAPNQVWSVVTSRPFQGALMGEHLAKWETAAQERIWGTVQQGILDGKPTPNIVRDVIEGGLNGAPMDLTQRQLEAVVRTSISHAASVARHEVALQNDDVIKAEKWSSTLDTRTSEICISNDGAIRKLGEDRWSNGYYGEPGQAHFNCRSSALMITKSWREMGYDIDDLPPSTRASMDGQVPADLTYSEWLAGQSKERLEDVLGKTRAELFLSGKETIQGFFNDGKLIKLEDLKNT